MNFVFFQGVKLELLVATKFFQVSCHFPWCLLNFSKFHDTSRFSMCTLIFPGFPDFPGRVGTLCGSILVSYTSGGRFQPFYCNDKYFCHWIQWKHLGTRMHSSRMCTIQSSSRLLGGWLSQYMLRYPTPLGLGLDTPRAWTWTHPSLQAWA